MKLSVWDPLSLKGHDNPLSSGENDPTDLNSLNHSERSKFLPFLLPVSFHDNMRLEELTGALRWEGNINCMSIGGNNSMLPLCISLWFFSSFNISTIARLTAELLLNNSNILLLLWVECIDDFRSRSDIVGVVKSLLICRMKELFLFEIYFGCIMYYLWEN